MKTQNQQYNVLFGNPDLHLKLNGAAITGFILTNNTYAILIKDLQKAIGYDGKSEHWLLEVLQSISRFNSVHNTLLEALEHPIAIIYQNDSGTEITLRAINVMMLPDLFEAIIQAKNDGFLNMSQLRFAKTSEQLREILQKSDIHAQIDESTGYNFYKNKAKNKLQKILADTSQDAAVAWIRTLPDHFFEVFFTIFDYNWIKLHENTEEFATIFNDVIFSRMSNDLLDSLRNTTPKRNYRAKHERDLQHPQFKIFTKELLVLNEKATGNKNIFLQLLNRMYPKNNSWIVKDAHFSNNTPVNVTLLSEFNASLQKSIFIKKDLVSKKKKA